MAQRFKRIIQSARYYAAVDNYIKYITDASKRSVNVGSGRNRPPSQRLFIDPFGIAMAAAQRVPVSAARPSWEAYSARFAGRTAAAGPADGNDILKPDGFSPARLVIVTSLSNNPVVKTSRITGMKYANYGGSSTSIPFGRKDATDTEAAAFEELKNAILPTLTNGRVSLIKEKI